MPALKYLMKAIHLAAEVELQNIRKRRKQNVTMSCFSYETNIILYQNVKMWKPHINLSNTKNNRVSWTVTRSWSIGLEACPYSFPRSVLPPSFGVETGVALFSKLDGSYHTHNKGGLQKIKIAMSTNLFVSVKGLPCSLFLDLYISPRASFASI